MLPAFAEAVRATTQPRTLLLLIPQLAMAVITKGRLAPFAAICVGAALGGWLFIANVVALSSAQLRLSGVLVAVTIGLVAAAPRVPQLSWFAGPGAETGAAGDVPFVAKLWRRPCVGVELGAILSEAAPAWSDSSAASPRTCSVRWFPCSPRALAAGRHDELVTALTRWSTS